VLQCVAVCCTVLQCVAVCRAPRKDEQDEVQCVAVCCSVLQYVAHLRKMSKMRCSVLQCVAVCCSVLQCVAVCRAPQKDEQDEVCNKSRGSLHLHAWLKETCQRWHKGHRK